MKLEYFQFAGYVDFAVIKFGTSTSFFIVRKLILAGNECVCDMRFTLKILGRCKIELRYSLDFSRDSDHKHQTLCAQFRLTNAAKFRPCFEI